MQLSITSRLKTHLTIRLTGQYGIMSLFTLGFKSRFVDTLIVENVSGMQVTFVALHIYSQKSKL